MITVNCRLNNSSMYPLADKEFSDANMKKKENGKYVGNEDTYTSSFLAIRSLLKKVPSSRRSKASPETTTTVMAKRI